MGSRGNQGCPSQELFAYLVLAEGSKQSLTMHQNKSPKESHIPSVTQPGLVHLSFPTPTPPSQRSLQGPPLTRCTLLRNKGQEPLPFSPC